MIYNFTIEFLDASDNILATENVTDEGLDWKSLLKPILIDVENKNITIDWNKISILVEKV